MERQGPPIHRFAAQVLAQSFFFSGQLEVIGNTLDFINDSLRDTLTLHQAHFASLEPGGPIHDLSRPLINVRKQDVILLHFTEAEAQASVRLLARKEPLIVYTPLAVVRASFHLAAEAHISDFVTSVPGAFMPCTAARVFPLMELASSFPQSCDLVLLGKQHVQFYHPA